MLHGKMPRKGEDSQVWRRCLVAHKLDHLRVPHNSNIDVR